jgi:hypothetical protein
MQYVTCKTIWQLRNTHFWLSFYGDNNDVYFSHANIYMEIDRKRLRKLYMKYFYVIIIITNIEKVRKFKIIILVINEVGIC